VAHSDPEPAAAAFLDGSELGVLHSLTVSRRHQAYCIRLWDSRSSQLRRADANRTLLSSSLCFTRPCLLPRLVFLLAIHAPPPSSVTVPAVLIITIVFFLRSSYVPSRASKLGVPLSAWLSQEEACYAKFLKERQELVMKWGPTHADVEPSTLCLKFTILYYSSIVHTAQKCFFPRVDVDM